MPAENARGKSGERDKPTKGISVGILLLVFRGVDVTGHVFPFFRGQIRKWKEVSSRPCKYYCAWMESCTSLKQWEASVGWYLQGSHHSRASLVVREADFATIHSRV